MSADPRGLVTTLVDVLLNQEAEAARDAARHGSTGMGFGETIERSERGYALRVSDMANPDAAEDAVIRLLREWAPQRAKELGIRVTADAIGGTRIDENLLRSIATATRNSAIFFRSFVTASPDSEISQADAVVFEGAQGLRLDMDLGVMPHVTRSNTGMTNIAIACAEAGIGHVNALYVTRAYATRHGAGPLPMETAGVSGWARVVDRTNAPNEWQGEIRAAPLDAHGLGDIIRRDLLTARGVSVSPSLGVTCVDQLFGRPKVLTSRGVIDVSAEDVVDAISEATGLGASFVSRAPKRMSDPGVVLREWTSASLAP